ncbi:hypothetical protein Tco_1574508, partial [Tanacetum coccineum]
RDNPLVSEEVLRYDIKRSKSENKGIVPTEMELVLEKKPNKVLVMKSREDGNPARANIKQDLDASVSITASAAAKPYQGDSSEFYLITGSIYTD